MAKCTIVVPETISQELQQDIIKLAVLRNSLNAYKRLREEVSAKLAASVEVQS
jgi:hypothetical protein